MIELDDRALGRVRAVCLSLEGAEESSLQGRPLFHVRRRRFAIFNGESSPPRARWASSGRSLHFLSEPDDRDGLLHDGRFAPSPHHGDRGWLAIRLDDGEADWPELTELLVAAHGLVVSPRR